MMRTLALLLLLGTQLHAGAAAGQYNEANALYRAGNFAAARRSYLEVVDSGVEDARIYYNLGNACFKSGKLGEAILWYERARRLLPHDEDIEANLRFSNLVKQGPRPANRGWPRRTGSRAGGRLFLAYVQPAQPAVRRGVFRGFCLGGAVVVRADAPRGAVASRGFALCGTERWIRAVVGDAPPPSGADKRSHRHGCRGARALRP